MSEPFMNRDLIERVPWLGHLNPSLSIEAILRQKNDIQVQA
jgi:hypothetical protein